MRKTFSIYAEILTFVRMTHERLIKCGLRPHLIKSINVMLSRLLGISISHLLAYFLVTPMIVIAFSCSNISTEEKVLYEELVPSELRERIKKAPIAYLPLGTLEYHGEQLPLGTDGIESEEFFKLLAREAGGVVLPKLFLAPDEMKIIDGVEYYSLDLYHHKKHDGSAYWVPDSVFNGMMEGILHQMKLQGFKIVVAHGHAPSGIFLRKHWQDWEKKFGLHIYSCVSWDARGYYDKEWNEKYKDYNVQGDHAAANETSLMMLFRPELVRMDMVSSDTSVKMPGIVGKDPRIYASREYAQKIVDLQLERLGRILKKDLESMK